MWCSFKCWYDDNLDNVTSFSSEPLVKPQPEKEKPKDDVKQETNGEVAKNGEKEGYAKVEMETEVKEAGMYEV